MSDSVTPSRPGRRLGLVAGAALAAVALLAPSASATDIPVTMAVPASTRTVTITDLQGNPIASLDGGPTAIRFSVVDDHTSLAPFSVLVEHTDFYLGDPATTTDRIGSSHASLTGVGPADVTGLGLDVLPTGTLAATLNGATCTALTLLSLSCNVVTGSVDANVINVPVVGATLDGTLSPLLPGGADGVFTTPGFSGPAAADPRASGAPTATQIEVLGGGSNPTGPASVVSAAVASLAGPASAVVADATIRTALRTLWGAAYDLLSSTVVDTVVAALQFTPVSSTTLDGSGTWSAVDTFAATFPAGSSPGSYTATMTVTLVQL